MRRFPQPGAPAAPPPPPPRKGLRRRAAPPPVEEPKGPSLQQIASRRPRPWIPILIFVVIFLALVYGCVANTRDHDDGAARTTLSWTA